MKFIYSFNHFLRILLIFFFILVVVYLKHVCFHRFILVLIIYELIQVIYISFLPAYIHVKFIDFNHSVYSNDHDEFIKHHHQFLIKNKLQKI